MTSPGVTSRRAGPQPGTDPAAVGRIVRLDGALDVAAAPALRERLSGLLQPGTGLLVLDLSLVSSCDSTGLGVLIGAERRARVLGIEIRLAAPSVPVTKLLRLTGLDRNFTIVTPDPGSDPHFDGYRLPGRVLSAVTHDRQAASVDRRWMFSSWSPLPSS
jgi:anti-anti-sigma factor